MSTYDLCLCYEPNIIMPKEQPDCPKSYYATEESGELYYYHDNTRIPICETFNPSGKPISKLIEDLVVYSAKIQCFKA